ncbi:ATPase V1 complex subunit C [Multifurca ochricompacta]|uniref:V-type proton ATPase subunit C n=1 Tax=Multifurca ochricompacta TaxID=376703 RepID=A0AAD4MDE8_9AGAM|nr:ATPase V1 complex subunit C [Multifurca ochricompacta]
MPSDQSTWLITVPQDGDSEGLLQELTSKLSQQSKTFSSSSIGQLYIPSFKTGTLDSLIALSEELPKHDATFTAAVAKIVETLRNLLNNDPSKLAQHILVNEKQRGLRDMTDILVKEMTSIDNVMKTKLNNYNLAKGSLVQLQRKKAGNLSVRSLADIVSKGDLLQDSEYMQSVLVAVPRNLVKNWTSGYERLATMVVPRSAVSLASDDEYSLFSVVIFSKVYDTFAQKCRENKYILRDFQYSVDKIEKEREELETADTAEKELWTELLRLSEINFSEAFQVFVHLKVVRMYIESVLRYGLPANYVGIAVKPEPKTTKRTLTTLQRHFSYLSARSQGRATSKRGGPTNEDFVGEYQSLLDQSFSTLFCTRSLGL